MDPRRMMMFTTALSILIMALAVPDIQGDKTYSIDIEPVPTERSPSDDGVIYTEPIDIGRPNKIAVIEIEGYGTVKFELYENMTPITTQNFIDLASTGFYDGISFHRCIDDFVAQTGDPNTKNMNPWDDGSGGSDKTIPLEICPNASHIDGAVGMARSAEPDTASSQFYFCDGPQHGLDDWERDGNGYAVFGVVIEGLDIVKDIAATETYGNRRPLLRDHPVDDIVMKSVYIIDGVWDNDTLEEETADKGSSSRELPFIETSILMIAVISTIFLLRRRRDQ